MGKKGRKYGEKGLIYRSKREQELIALAKQMRKEFDRQQQHLAAAKALVALEVFSQSAVFAVNALADHTQRDDPLTDTLMVMLSTIREIQRRVARQATAELGFSLLGDATEIPDPAPFVAAIERLLLGDDGADFLEK